MKSPRFNSVEDYLASVDPTKARTIKGVIDLILVEFPELESKISWNVPNIHRNGKYVAGIAAYKHHLTFAPWSPSVIQAFKVEVGKICRYEALLSNPCRLGIRSKIVEELSAGPTSRAGPTHRPKITALVADVMLPQCHW